MTIEFVGKISKMGEKLLIIIPREFHSEFIGLEGKQTKITINQDELENQIHDLEFKFIFEAGNIESQKSIVDAITSYGKIAIKQLSELIAYSHNPYVTKHISNKIQELNLNN